MLAAARFTSLLPLLACWAWTAIVSPAAIPAASAQERNAASVASVDAAPSTDADSSADAAGSAPADVSAVSDARPLGQVLVVVGPSQHPPGTHEVAAGARLIQYCLQNATNLPSVPTTVVDRWPAAPGMLDRVGCVVFLGDQFPPHQMPDSETTMAQLQQLMDRGGSIVCIHFATGLREPHIRAGGDHPLLHWMGGYFSSRSEHHQSVARLFPAAHIQPSGLQHPVNRGWQAFTVHDEPYIENYFGPPGMAQRVGLLEFAVSPLPPEQPKRQVVAWGLQRPDGGRGFGVVMPHFYRNWADDNLRTLILNGIVWSAGREVPAAGVQVDLPPLETFQDR